MTAITVITQQAIQYHVNILLISKRIKEIHDQEKYNVIVNHQEF